MKTIEIGRRNFLPKQIFFGSSIYFQIGDWIVPTEGYGVVPFPYIIQLYKCFYVKKSTNRWILNLVFKAISIPIDRFDLLWTNRSSDNIDHHRDNCCIEKE